MHLSEVIQKAILIRDYLKNFMDDPTIDIKWRVRPSIRFCWLFTTLQKLLSVGRITLEPGLGPVPSSKSTYVTVLIIRGTSHGSWPRAVSSK